MILRVSLLATIFALLVSGALFLGYPQGTSAEDHATGKAKTSKAWQYKKFYALGPDMRVAAARPTVFKSLGWAEAGKWATDFILNPKNAGNREVMHVYALKNAQGDVGEEIRALLAKLQHEKKDVRVAVVFLDAGTTPSIPIEIRRKYGLAPMAGYLAVPMGPDPASLKYLANSSNLAAVAAAITKTFYGMEAANLHGIKGYIAVNHELQNLTPLKIRLIAAKTAWPAGRK